MIMLPEGKSVKLAFWQKASVWLLLTHDLFPLSIYTIVIIWTMPNFKRFYKLSHTWQIDTLPPELGNVIFCFLIHYKIHDQMLKSCNAEQQNEYEWELEGLGIKLSWSILNYWSSTYMECLLNISPFPGWIYIISITQQEY
jgi:hypothetical protein